MTLEQVSVADLLLQTGMVRMSRAARVTLAVLSGLAALLLRLCRLLEAPRCAAWLWKVLISLSSSLFFVGFLFFVRPIDFVSSESFLSPVREIWRLVSHTPSRARHLIASLRARKKFAIWSTGRLNTYRSYLMNRDEVILVSKWVKRWVCLIYCMSHWLE